MHIGLIELSVEIKGQEMTFDVYGKVYSGGSSSWGSDEPPWFDVEIYDIRWCGRKVSDKLWDKITSRYKDITVEGFQNKYL